MPVVFISYSHDSDAHRERVRGLHASLARDGCDCRLDVFKDTDEDWPSWMAAQLIEADFVLCVVTETYELRFRDRELPDQGLGVGWEAGLIRRLLYAKKLHNNRIFPVIFNKEDKKRIPLELQGYDFFHPDGQTGYETLLRKILNRPEHEKPATGTPPNLLTGTTPPLFVRPGEIAPASIPNDISRIVKYAPEKLIGREAETKLLDDAWLGTQSFQPAGIGKSPLGSEGAIGQDREPEASRTQTHIVTFVALGGEGKTSLVAKWAVELAAKNWPGCEAVFAWSFYSQGTREQNASSSDLFLAEALRFFGDEETAASAKGAYEKGQRLARLVGQRRALLILDGVEPLQHAPTSPMPGELKDQGLAALLKNLATTNRGLCVVTTRYSIPDVRGFVGKTVREEKLSRLSTSAGAALLKALGVKGSERKTIPASKPRWNEYEALVEDVQGHALTLNLLGTYLRDAHNGDIRQRDLIHLAEANSEELGGHAFRVMDAYVDWLASAEPETLNTSRRALALWQLMGLFDRPATADCLQALWQAPPIEGLTEPLIGLTEAQRNVALKRLEDARLLTVNRDAAGRLLSLDAHPLVREYFAERVRSSAFRRQRLGTSRRRLTAAQPPKGGTTNMWREAHRRIYEHLCETTKEGETPTLEELQPLYQAVAHGCLAGLQQEACVRVYRDRILRGTGSDGFYSGKKLGAFGSDLGAVACFF